MSKQEEYSYTMLGKLLIGFLTVHLLAVITLILTFSADHEVANTVIVPQSSVWCTGDSIQNRRCFITNLCYSFENDDFVFVRGATSAQHGLPTVEQPVAHTNWTAAVTSPRTNDQTAPHTSPRTTSHRSVIGGPLTDLSGGVENLNNRDYQFSYVEVLDSAIRSKKLSASILPDKVVILKRFKPDNLMHVIHDDLLPLYYALLELEFAGAKEYRVFLVDDYEKGNFWNLYRLFKSKIFLNANHPWTKQTLRAEVSTDLVCFSTAVVGGMPNTRWYQYGFNRFQGPVEKRQITGHEIRSFAAFVRHGLEVPRYDIDKPHYSARTRQKYPYAVIINRKLTRRILNEIDLSLAVAREFDLRTVTVNLETHSMGEIVHVLQNATMLIAMHGAQLVLSMFLPVNAVVIELFPLGIPSHDYTPYKTLASIDGMNLIYRAWENKDQSKSLSFPERDPLLGGIAHLPREQREVINKTLPVEQHFCCGNLAFLHRMYQDTEVDLGSFMEVAKDAFAERAALLEVAATSKKTVNTTDSTPSGKAEVSSRFSHLTHGAVIQDEPMTTSTVRNIQCAVVPSRKVLHIDWEPPWNLQYISADSIYYELRVQSLGDSGTVQGYFSNSTEMEVPFPGLQKESQLWISCVVDGSYGAFNTLPVICSA